MKELAYTKQQNQKIHKNKMLKIDVVLLINDLY